MQLQHASSCSQHCSADDILGPKASRFFGTGYRHVVQQIREARVDSVAQTASAISEVKYPDTWSRKRERELKPHLSSIDGLVLGAQLCEVFLREACGLDSAEIARSWICQIGLKAGQSPTLDLGAVPMQVSLLGTRKERKSLCGYQSEFDVQVGTMVGRLTIDHPRVKPRHMVERVADLDYLDQDERFYGARYRDIHVAVENVLQNDHEKRARARVVPSLNADAPQVKSGLAADYHPFISAIHAIVATAQLAQIVMYRLDGLVRERSNNLWMRRIAITAPMPMVTPPDFWIETGVTSTTLVPVKGRKWRSAEFGLGFPSLTADYCVAHELP